jgi:hypothetical protein
MVSEITLQIIEKKIFGSFICDKSNYLSASFYLGYVVKNKTVPIVKGHTMLCVKNNALIISVLHDSEITTSQFGCPTCERSLCCPFDVGAAWIKVVAKINSTTSAEGKSSCTVSTSLASRKKFCIL